MKSDVLVVIGYVMIFINSTVTFGISKSCMLIDPLLLQGFVFLADILLGAFLPPDRPGIEALCYPFQVT